MSAKSVKRNRQTILIQPAGWEQFSIVNEGFWITFFFNSSVENFGFNRYDLTVTDVIGRREKDLPFLIGVMRNPSTGNGRGRK